MEASANITPSAPTAVLSLISETQKATATAILARVEAEVSSALEIEVTDDLSFAQAGEALRSIKGFAKKLETARTTMKAPVLEAGREIDAFFKTPANRLSDAEKALKQRVAAYQIEQDRIRREAEALARAEQERIDRARREAEAAARAELEAQLDAGEVPFDVEEPAAPAPEPTVIVPEVARVEGVSMRRVTRARVADLRAIVAAAAAGNAEAFALLEVNQSALNAYARAHTVDTGTVPGVSLYEDTVVSARGL